MLYLLLAVLLLVALSVALLSIRLICGKERFVRTHIDQSPAMKALGITCAKKQDEELSKHSGLRISERK